MQVAAPKRHDGRIIIHFDYDCFYAAVFEREDPKLKSLPFAVQQKQIIVTCNYEARRRGLYKLQLVREARKKCPDVIIVLGEDLTRFRNASKDNYNFLRGYMWSNKVERLGFDEVFMDVTDIIDYNAALLNYNNLASSFFHLDRNDPTVGFSFDASHVFGHVFPVAFHSSEVAAVSADEPTCDDDKDLLLRLRLGSHLAQHLRHRLDEQKGYTSTVGISTNKLISKLVGNVNKPTGQTTLLPPYNPQPGKSESNVTKFIDDHDIGKIPGIGFKTAQKIRNHVLGRPAAFSAGLVYGPTKESVKVRDVRTLDGIGPELLGRLLTGPGVPKDLAEKVWGLINGVDDAEVAKAKEVPQQISIEDSYLRLDEIEHITKELKMLSTSLIKRMRLDLTSALDEDDMEITSEEEEDDAPVQVDSAATPRRWIAHPKILRLSTRPRPPLNPDGTRSRTFKRISKSTNMPIFVFSFAHSVDVLANRLVEETLVPLFHKLHPEKSEWNLSLVNVCATNMSLTASDGKDGAGRDISRMFRRQDDVLGEWKVEDVDIAPSNAFNDQRIPDDGNDRIEDKIAQQDPLEHPPLGSEDLPTFTQESLRGKDEWDSDEEMQDAGDSCSICGAVMPPYAMLAHERFHDLPD